jgi:DNA modification methylase
LALEGKADLERLEALGITIQPYDHLSFSTCDDRFGTEAYPGRIPGQLVAHILYWFTRPGEYVIDPMAGGGTVLDVCLAMGRKCYAYDINQSDRVDIMPHNLAAHGWPERTKKADLIFWDPPYFDKKDADYPEGSISRLERGAYLDVFKKAFTEAKQQVKRGTTLAFLMSDWNDVHDAKPKRPGIFIHQYINLLCEAGWHFEEHIQVPLSTQAVDPRTVLSFREKGWRARLEHYLLIATA